MTSFTAFLCNRSISCLYFPYAAIRPVDHVQYSVSKIYIEFIKTPLCIRLCSYNEYPHTYIHTYIHTPNPTKPYTTNTKPQANTNGDTKADPYTFHKKSESRKQSNPQYHTSIHNKTPIPPLRYHGYRSPDNHLPQLPSVQDPPSAPRTQSRSR